MIESYDGQRPTIEETAYVHSAATVIGRVTIGAKCSIWPRAVLRGDDNPIAVGSQTNIQDGVVVHTTGGLSTTVVGDRVTVGHSAILHGCQIGDDTLIGMGAILLDNCKIARNVIVGAGTVIPMNKEIPEGVLVLGNPFKIVRELTEKDLGWIDYSWRHYVEQGATYAARD
ncbi:MAG: gamma carbonic anhydrase family protein [bacterium]|nr:gamma carbonic anhydrase family protein [bacterium]